MTFWDHLDDLRNTLLRMAGVFFVVAVETNLLGGEANAEGCVKLTA
jgi:hypothetical protein